MAAGWTLASQLLCGSPSEAPPGREAGRPRSEAIGGPTLGEAHYFMTTSYNRPSDEFGEAALEPEEGEGNP
jgi:hypothetical protein